MSPGGSTSHPDGIVAAGGRPMLVHSRKVRVLLELRRDASRAGSGVQQAGHPVGGGTKFGDNPVGLQRPAVDEPDGVSHPQGQAEAAWLYGQPSRRRPTSRAFQRLCFRLAFARCDTGRAAQGGRRRAGRRRDWRADPRGPRLQVQQPAMAGRMDARPGCQGRRPAQRRQGDRQGALVSRVV